MAQRFTMELDEKLQIIRQALLGDLDENDSFNLEEATAKLVEKLRDPASVRLLVDARKNGKMSLKGRKRLMANMQRDNVKKMAFWGASPIARAMITIFGLAAGPQKMRSFPTEEKALEWLLC